MLVEYGIVHRAGREPGSNRARSVGLLHIGRDAQIAEEDRRGAAGHRLDPIHRLEIAVDRRRAEIQLVALARRGAVAGQNRIQQLDVDGEVGLGAPIHFRLGALHRRPDRRGDGRRHGEDSHQRQARHDAEARQEFTPGRPRRRRRALRRRGAGEFDHGDGSSARTFRSIARQYRTAAAGVESEILPTPLCCRRLFKLASVSS